MMHSSRPRQAVGRQPAVVLGAALPVLTQSALRECCAACEAALEPWLTPEQQAHIQNFADSGAALAARCSRLLARALMVHGLGLAAAAAGLPQPRPGPDLCLSTDSLGRPTLPGWRVAFSHSGKAAFCALQMVTPDTRVGRWTYRETVWALDAESLDSPAPCARAFATAEQNRLLSPATAARDALRRWTVKEAVLKALGAGLTRDPATLPSGRAGQRAGLLHLEGRSIVWRLLPCPGHWLCLALPEECAHRQKRPRPALRFYGAAVLRSIICCAERAI